ncbi:MAG: TfuA-like protein [Devosia sp.]|uniref:TfuA-like protein n=1 Tax=Devosia sp. TaxID=1871048 RepID=UPI001A49D568|nr:TfuA-like protein [Devosia sp.]MBL8597558.1 TfuA-like protein [Devosia sp.]
MKIAFAGPSLYGADYDAGDVVVRGPAQMGDVERAMADGATAIGLIDGHYQQVGAVWHKEILLALSAGVAVYGAASMGALRAAECEAFGMVPVGSIAGRYCSGALFDDADVALTNGPAELGFPPLTEAMVDVAATLAHLAALGLVTPSEAQAVSAAARKTFFADRTVAAVFDRLDHPRAPALRGLYDTHRVSQKTQDALELLDLMKSLQPGAAAAPADWRFANSPFWTGRVTPRSSSVTSL